MAQQTMLDCLLEAISDDESLREALRAHFLPGMSQNTEVDRRAANWSSRSTFEQFYYRLSNSATFSRTILQSAQDERYFIAV